MKLKLKVILFVILFLNNFSFAQTINYGFKLGVTNSNIIVTDEKPVGPGTYLDYVNGNSINPSIGIFVNYEIINNLKLETELNYVQKGARETKEISYITPPDTTEKNSKFTTESGLQYLEFGVNIKPYINISNTNVYGIIGSSVNYLVQSTAFMQKDLKDVIFSYRLGAGIDLKNLITIPIFVEIKYEKDISEFYSYKYGKFRNKLLIFNIGINL